ncbi:MAG: hemerythrin family protein [Treponema sp.]|nr:hemerythrin family protein [Treponema sp.]
MRYTWTAAIAVGYELIDEQHKKLFEAINAFLSASEQGEGKDELQKNLRFLSDYTIKHFSEEEAIQQKYKYPDYENHRKYHETCKAVVRELSHELILKGPSETLIKDVQVKVGDWLVEHIKVQDVKLGAYLKSVEDKK